MNELSKTSERLKCSNCKEYFSSKFMKKCESCQKLYCVNCFPIPLEKCFNCQIEKL